MRFRDYLLAVNKLLFENEEMENNLISEINIDDVIEEIKKLKSVYNLVDVVKLKNSQINVLITISALSNPRILREELLYNLINELEKIYPDFEIVHNRRSSLSSIGVCEIKSTDYGKVINRSSVIRLVIKYHETRIKSPGKDNEVLFVNKINEYIEELGGIADITFEGSNISKTFSNILRCEDASTDTSDNKKSDANLFYGPGKEDFYPISIKKANASRWSVATSMVKNNKELSNYLYHEFAKLEKEGVVYKVDDSENSDYRITNDVVLRANAKDVKEIVFGTDIIEKDGAIVYQTFSPSDFKIDNGEIRVDAELIIDSINTLPESHYPYLVIQNNPRGAGDLYVSNSIETIRYRKLYPTYSIKKKNINSSTAIFLDDY